MTEKGLELIKEFEGFRSDAYWDATGKVWTIGYGSTYYLDGSKVNKGDTITNEDATKLLERLVEDEYEVYVDQCVTSSINPYQRDALTSFTYNCGVGNLKRSSLLKKVNADPADPLIRDEFAKWNKSGGQVLNGLIRRRNAEADLYFTEYKQKNPEPKKNTQKQQNPKPSVVVKETPPHENKTVEKEDKSLLAKIVEWIASLFS